MSYRRSLDLSELAEELDELRDRREFAAENPDDDDAEPLEADEEARYEALAGLESELGDLHIASRNKGPFIAEVDFEDYAAEVAEDLGVVSRDCAHYLDRARWADDLQSDYSSVEFDGETYYYSD